MIVVRVGIYPIDFDRGEIFDLKAFSAVIAYLVRIQIADLTLKASVTFFFLIEDAHFSFHGI